jgi:hypothetical protein
MKFCPECGTPLSAHCPNCGAEHAPGQKFCAECGQPLSEAAATLPIAPPSPQTAALPDAAEMRLVSVMFVDLVGFTSLSESRDAADVWELLGRYFDSARTIVERYGGTIEVHRRRGDGGVGSAGRSGGRRRAGGPGGPGVVDAVAVFGVEVDAPDLRARAGVVTGQVAAFENPGEGLVVGDRVRSDEPVPPRRRHCSRRPSQPSPRWARHRRSSELRTWRLAPPWNRPDRSAARPERRNAGVEPALPSDARC